MDAAQERDFEEFVRRRSSSLLQTAYLLTGDRGHAEDLLQTVLLSVAGRWASIDGPKEPYVRRALVNGATSVWRRRRLVESPLELSAEPWVEDRTTEVVERAEILRSLRQLSARQRAVIVLRYFEGLSEAEIAQALGCSTGAVKSYASRALTHLRRLSPQPAPTESRDVREAGLR
jgi:RNA polymerase sigma-70 factor (sigma-E family)